MVQQWGRSSPFGKRAADDAGASVQTLHGVETKSADIQAVSARGFSANLSSFWAVSGR